MHGDLIPKVPGKKARKGAKRKVVTADSPPDPVSRQVFFLGLAGLLGLPLGILLGFGLIEGGITVLLYILWAGSVPCMILAAWRGKFEIDAINHGASAPRGRTFAFVGMVCGAGSFAANVLILIVIIGMAIFAGSGDAAPETAGGNLGSPKSAIKYYFEAIKKDKFDEFKRCLSARQVAAGEDGADREEPDKILKSRFKRERGQLKTLVVSSVRIKETIDGKNVIVEVSLDDKSGGRILDKEYRMVREGDEWKVDR